MPHRSSSCQIAPLLSVFSESLPELSEAGLLNGHAVEDGLPFAKLSNELIGSYDPATQICL